jgi:glycosyltransferase 2 family protein
LLKKVKKNIFISLAVAGLLYLGFTIYANFDNVIFAFASFNWFIIPLLLLLSLTNYCIRFLKWHYYINLIDVKIKIIDSFSIFMSGLIMSVTPGKMGELLKSYLVKEVTKTPISKTFPIVFVERITDFVSLIFIALFGAYVFDFGRGIVIGVGIFFLIVLVLLSNRSIAIPLIGLFEKSKFLRKHLESIHNAYESSYQMLRPLPLIYMTLLSIVSWSFECLGYHLILINFNIGVSFLWSAFSYCFAIIVGSITMLPGGLGVTEGSLTFMLIRNNFPKNIAVASTFIIRVATLWFAVLIGIFSVTIYQRRFGKISVETV